MATRTPARLALRNRLSAAPRVRLRERRAIALFGAALIVAAALVFTQLFEPAGAIDWQRLAERLRDKAAAGPWSAILLPLALIVLSVLQIGYLVLARRRERLILTENEMRYRSPLPGPLEALRPGWTLRWDEVNRARLYRRRGMSGPLSVRLELVTLRGTRRVAPWQWIDPQASEATLQGETLRGTRTLAGPPLLGAVLDSPLMRFATARLRQLDTDAVLAGNSAGYALEHSPRALAVVVLFFALVGYALTDTVVNTDAYAGEPPYGLFAGWGALGAGLAWLWMRAGEVPALERGVVALLLGAALGAALHPGLLRVNAATDADGPHTYRYRLLDDLTLQPPLQGLPPLDFSRYREYWRQFRPGSTHPIVLRRGALEFYQVDMAPLRAALRAFYEKQP